jgi:hypothetical protein
MGLLPNLKRASPTKQASLPAFPSPDGGHAQLELKIELKEDKSEYVAGERVEGLLKIDVKAADGQLALGDLRIIMGGHESKYLHQALYDGLRNGCGLLGVTARFSGLCQQPHTAPPAIF